MPAVIDLRTDEAYYWTWSKENVLSFLDHPPDGWRGSCGPARRCSATRPFGARVGGLLAMAGMQCLLADIVRRKTLTRVEPVLFVLLAPEATLYYGLMMTLVAPDVPPWCPVPVCHGVGAGAARPEPRSHAGGWRPGRVRRPGAALEIHPPRAVRSGHRWPSCCGHPGVGWLLTPYPWLAAPIALVMFLPVLIWNAQHDWASFRFQLVRATAGQQWSLRIVGDFVGLQFGLVGSVLFPVCCPARC